MTSKECTWHTQYTRLFNRQLFSFVDWKIFFFGEMFVGDVYRIEKKTHTHNPTAFFEFEGERCIFLWTKLLAQYKLTLNWIKKKWWIEGESFNDGSIQVRKNKMHYRSQINALRRIKSIYQLKLRFSVPYCIFCVNMTKTIMFIDWRSHWFSRFESPLLLYEWKKIMFFFFLPFDETYV